MDYEEQNHFLRRYHRWCALLLVPATVFYALGSLPGATGLLDAGLSGRPDKSGWFWFIVSAAKLLLLLLGFLIAVFYLPKYFRLTGDPAKKYRWTVRTTWILGGLAAAFVIALGQAPIELGQGRRQMAVYLMLVGVALLTNLLAWQRLSLRPAYRRMPDLAFAYLFGGVVVWMSFRVATNASPVSLAFVATFWLLWFVLNAEGNGAWLALVVWAGFLAEMLAFESSASASARVLGLGAGSLFFILGAAWLSRLAERQNRRNLDRTMGELAAFFGETPEQSRKRAMAGVGQLAAEWRKSRPAAAGEEAVRQWYQEVSEIYVYAAAEFHLIYKHIAFTLEILPLLRGRVLDFGAGIGDLSIAAAKRGCQVTHLDVPGQSQEFARWLASREGTALAFAADLKELDGSFDTIVSLDVLEHVVNLEEVLGGLASRLASGGRMILAAYFGPTEPHPQHIAHRLDIGRFLGQRGLRDRKGLRRKLFGSEIMRKKNVLIFEKDADGRITLEP